MEQSSSSVITRSAYDTEHFGEQIGAQLKGGEVIDLSSDVGGGKTTLVRGVVRGAGSSDVVASPTFTVSKLYGADDFSIVHFDFYRIQHDAVTVAHELAEASQDATSVVLIEWSEAVRDLLPEQTIVMVIQPINETERQITWHCPPEKEYVFAQVES